MKFHWTITIWSQCCRRSDSTHLCKQIKHRWLSTDFRYFIRETNSRVVISRLWLFWTIWTPLDRPRIALKLKNHWTLRHSSLSLTNSHRPYPQSQRQSQRSKKSMMSRRNCHRHKPWQPRSLSDWWQSRKTDKLKTQMTAKVSYPCLWAKPEKKATKMPMMAKRLNLLKHKVREQKTNLSVSK